MAGPNDWVGNPKVDSQAFRDSLKQYVDTGDAAAAVSASPLAVALGVQFEPFPAACANNQSAPVTQIAYGVAVYATAGAVITGVKIRNGVAAAGTLPTTARFGLADNTGKILALSGNVNALASWATGVCPMAFTALFTLTYSGVYLPCFVVNGTWGTTQPTPNETAVTTAIAMVADGVNPPVNFQWTGQTDLPLAGASLTLTSASTRSYYLALY